MVESGRSVLRLNLLFPVNSIVVFDVVFRISLLGFFNYFVLVGFMVGMIARALNKQPDESRHP